MWELYRDSQGTESQPKLDREIENAVYLAGCVLSALVTL